MDEIRRNIPDQNAINLSNLELTESQKSLSIKGQSFVPTPKDINWFHLRQDSDKFVNQLRYRAKNHVPSNEAEQQNVTTNSNDLPLQPPKRKKKTPVSYKSNETKLKSLEAFIDVIEKELFNPNNIRKVHRHITNNIRKVHRNITNNIRKVHRNITKEENVALQEMNNFEEHVIRVQDKGSRFVVLLAENYEMKVQHQIGRSSFVELNIDPSVDFEEKVKNWITKWKDSNIDKKWIEFIKPVDSTPGKMYGLVKTQKNDNPVRVITSGCNTSVENLSIFVESILFKESENLKSRIRDTNHMLCIIDDLPNNSILVSFDVVNMFPSIHNESGLEAVTKVLNL